MAQPLAVGLIPPRTADMAPGSPVINVIMLIPPRTADMQKQTVPV